MRNFMSLISGKEFTHSFVKELVIGLMIAGLLRRRGRALMAHRSPQRRWYPDAWDLPGGHIQVGEVPRQCDRSQ